MNWLYKLLAFLLLNCLAVPALHAQGKADVFVFGKDKGSVSLLKANDADYLDVQKTVKKLGGNVELFAASKQIKASFKGFYAILTAGEASAIVNAETVKLSAPALAYRGKIYAPADFFTLPALQKTLDRQIAWSDGALYVERNFTLALEGKTQTPEGDVLLLRRQKGVSYKTEQVNKHTVRVTFAGAVLKRDLNWRLKDPFISSASISQKGSDAVLNIILGKNASHWSFDEEAGQLAFKASQGKLSAVTVPQQPVQTPAAREPAAQPSAKPATPSVTEEDFEDAEEMDLGGPALTALTPTVIGPASSSAASKPVLKPGVPTVIAAAPAKKKMRVVIDAGHGGKDPGAVRRGSAREKELNLAVAKHLYNYLKKQGFEVKLTRDDDTFISLSERPKIANNFKADLFVSVHTNASKRTAANGVEVYFRSEKATDKEAAEVAAFENEALQYEETHYNFVDALLQSLAKNEYMNESSKAAGHVRNAIYKEPGISIPVRQANSVRQANFYVLKGVSAPSILVEMGYISNPNDRKRLNTKAVQKRMGEGIGKGVEAYAKAEGWDIK